MNHVVWVRVEGSVGTPDIAAGGVIVNVVL